VHQSVSQTVIHSIIQSVSQFISPKNTAQYRLAFSAKGSTFLVRNGGRGPLWEQEGFFDGG